MTAFFGVHLALTAASLALGTVIGWLGVRIVRGQSPRPGGDVSAPQRSGVERGLGVDGSDGGITVHASASAPCRRADHDRADPST